MNKVLEIATDPFRRFDFLSSHGFLNQMPDEVFLRKKFQLLVGRTLNLESPEYFCDKLQWLKLYDRNPLYNRLVDKYEVKQFVSSKIGSNHIIPTYGIWSHFDDIDFDSLPNQFILKCTHDSGSFAICKDKRQFNKEKARLILEKGLSHNMFYRGREWAYKDVEPRIIAEEYLPTLGNPDSIEYKFTCFDGRVELMTICKGIAHSDLNKRTNDNFDRNGNKLPFYAYYKPSTQRVELPKNVDEIISICETLSKGIPQVRVDTYMVDGHIFFGEMTFYTWSGFIIFSDLDNVRDDKWDKWLGDKIVLPSLQNYDLKT